MPIWRGRGGFEKSDEKKQEQNMKEKFGKKEKR
jgi:hypothetical protein